MPTDPPAPDSSSSSPIYLSTREPPVLTPLLRQRITSALLAQGHIQTIQTALLPTLDPSRWRARALELFREEGAAGAGAHGSTPAESVLTVVRTEERRARRQQDGGGLLGLGQGRGDGHGHGEREREREREREEEMREVRMVVRKALEQVVKMA